MIGLLSGKVAGHIGSQIILKTPSGVGYLVHVSLMQKSMVNDFEDLYILEVRREDKSELYGFRDIKDRVWVENLLKVNGVGPKVAASIIYALGWENLVEAIESEDAGAISEVKGLGIKTAKKIVLELKGSRTDINNLNFHSNEQSVSDFTDTLVNLGYKKSEIVGVISKMKKDGVWKEENLVEMVKIGLKYFGK